jgi:hypothetical protein
MTWFRRRRQATSSEPERVRPHSVAAPAVPDDPPTPPGGWRLGSWDRPDLKYAKAHAEPRREAWERWVPNLELVRCGDKVEPALFFKTGYSEVNDWATTVEPVTFGWNWYRSKGAAPYVVIELHVKFVNRSGTAIGLGGVGQHTVMTEAVHRYAHRLKTRTLLDPGDQRHREAIEAWVAGPAPTMLFFVDEQGQGTSYVSMRLGPAEKRDLLRVLAEATEELDGEGIVPGGFPEACEYFKDSLPSTSWWNE